MVKHYLFAGVDLMVSKDKKIYFIEANSAPYGLKAYVDLKESCKPLDALVKFLKNYRIVAIMHNYSGVEVKQSAWVVNYLKKRMKNLEVCILADNRKNFIHGDGSLVTKDGRLIKPDVLLRQHWSSKRSRPIALKKAGVKIINPICVVETTKNKVITQKAVRRYAKGVNCPKQFPINSVQEVLPLLKRNKKVFKKGFVLKPQRGTRSEGVFVLDSYEHFPKGFMIKEPYILEERIIPLGLFKGRYFDVRAHAVNGKYAGCVLRVSKGSVTGISAGAKPSKIPKRLEVKVKPVVEKVVRAIDKFSEKFL